jgi:hypothetical protein
MAAAVEEWVRFCEICQCVGRKQSPEPMARSKLHEAPWSAISKDSGHISTQEVEFWLERNLATSANYKKRSRSRTGSFQEQRKMAIACIA